MTIPDLLKEAGNSQAVNALVWAFFHSLWQGGLLAIIAGIFISSTKKTRPTIRYNALCILSLLMVLTSIFTFCFVYKRWPGQNGLVQMQVAVERGTHLPYHLNNLSTYSGFVNGLLLKINRFISQYSGWIGAVWFLLSFIKASRLIFTLSYTGYIRRYKSWETADFWMHKVNALCVQLKIHQPVLLLESALLKIPVVYGFFKPIIFFPLGLLSQLSTEQIEAILLHELAHIRRQDYLVNLIQQAAEIILFFNPAVLWLSARIREEREHCCDEIAIAQTKDRRKYIETLIIFKELSLTHPLPAGMAFTGVTHGLVNRVSRIVYRQDRSLHLIEKSGLFACGIAFVFCLCLFTPNHPTTRLPAHLQNKELTTGFPLAKVITEINKDLALDKLIGDKKNISFELTNTWLYINGVRQPDYLWKKLSTKYLKSSPYPIRPEFKNDPGFGIFFNTSTHVYGIGTRPPGWES